MLRFSVAAAAAVAAPLLLASTAVVATTTNGRENINVDNNDHHHRRMPVMARNNTLATTDQYCNPPCQNGAQCVPFWSNQQQEQEDEWTQEDQQQQHWQCLCPDGYAGTACERRRRAQACNLDQDNVLFCKNGGECAGDHDSWVDLVGGDAAICDCTNAEDILADQGLVQFVGRECDIPVLQENYCAGQNRSKHKDLFCVNGGECRGGAEDYKKKPCNCPDTHTGRHCEYGVDEVQDECVLSCSGHGTCQHGVHSRPEAGANDLVPGNAWDTYMHCICDEDYAGTNCEYEYTQCETRGLYCFHGSTCATINDEEVCKCTAGNGQNLAGEFCEYRATDDCNNNPGLPTYPIAHPEYSMEIKDFPFCVNNGVCKLDTDDLFYCECDGKYVGMRCEHKDIKVTAPPPPAPFSPFAPSPLSPVAPTAAPTEWNTETYYPTVEASRSYFPTVAVDVTSDSPTSSSTQEEENGKSADGLEAGAVFFIVLIVMTTVVVFIWLVCRFRRNQRAINQGDFNGDSGNGGYTDNNGYNDNEEVPGSYEMTSTASSKVEESNGPTTTGNGGVLAPKPDMADVELV
mmetsp:Transcript_4122/g.11243  ORF Transcript_4122/g.11243 Transcript_4122/m.11243 type:complete len:573 (+) Transcript_4122:98-1816(+)|eukprot:CAMPEP_0168744366 /NCGR_PEP_ID=MMETSP0724-20121128/14054_1 /TAXON_ID=265536 /ORGANISM="Amphiprora sp., Strain CCMP467" /LENGTH=572 /DNA_ID=CAMNT_0008792023 /DNA_START=47 /DNA_END=1765 /DNA_ORIENTATION=-